MPTPQAQAVGISFDDIKLIMWFLGAFASALLAGISVTWWFNKELSSTRKDLYVRMNTVQKEIDTSINSNKDDCRDTKERVGLLEQSTDHHEKQMDKMDETLSTIEKDLSATKDSVVELAQKSREDTLMIMGEMRAMEGRSQIAMMGLKETIVEIVNQRKRKDDN